MNQARTRQANLLNLLESELDGLGRNKQQFQTDLGVVLRCLLKEFTEEQILGLISKDGYAQVEYYKTPVGILKNLEARTAVTAEAARKPIDAESESQQKEDHFHNEEASAPGTVGWIDLTVKDCEGTRSFYEQVVGWHSSAVSLGDYEDYCVHPSAGDDPVAGICHARGPNADLPSSWVIYLTVADLEASLKKCETMGGTILHRRAPDSYGHIAVIRDPAGAVCALFQPK